MAQFPNAEADMVVLANAMVAGYGAHAADFPSADALALTTALSGYGVAKNAQINAMGVAQVATETKDVKVAALEDVMRAELKKSEVDVGGHSEKLEYIGWGPKAPPSPAARPGQPRDLEAIMQGPGPLLLDWKGPARGTGGIVRTYLIERREQPAGGGPFGVWAQVAIALESEILLADQPRGQQLEYRILAVNTGGKSIPSNTAAVVL